LRFIIVIAYFDFIKPAKSNHFGRLEKALYGFRLCLAFSGLLNTGCFA
jgi:hypothetical protein